MAMTSILLLGAATLFLLGGKKKVYKAYDGTVFSNEKDRDAYNVVSESKKEDTKEKEDAKAVAEAANAIKQAEAQLASKLTISDATIQMFDNNNGKIWQTAHCYVWVKFKNIGDKPLMVEVNDIAATILHTSNGKPFDIVKKQVIVPAYTETKWIKLTSNYSSIFKKPELYADIKNYMPVESNFFLPSHLVIKYDVYIPNQDTILVKDAIYEQNVETYFIYHNDKSEIFEMSKLPKKDSLTGYYYMVNSSPDEHPKYQAYLDILRDSKSPIKDKMYPTAPLPTKYTGMPVRYILKANNEDGARRSMNYKKLKYTGQKGVLGVWQKSAEPIYLPYLGIVYNDKGVVAYE